MMSSTSENAVSSFVLDDEDRVTILQLLTLSPSERLQYLLDELAFDDAVANDQVNG